MSIGRISLIMLASVLLSGCYTSYYSYKGTIYKLDADNDLDYLDASGRWAVVNLEAVTITHPVVKNGTKITAKEAEDEQNRRRCNAGNCAANKKERSLRHAAPPAIAGGVLDVSQASGD